VSWDGPQVGVYFLHWLGSHGTQSFSKLEQFSSVQQSSQPGFIHAICPAAEGQCTEHVMARKHPSQDRWAARLIRGKVPGEILGRLVGCSVGPTDLEVGAAALGEAGDAGVGRLDRVALDGRALGEGAVAAAVQLTGNKHTRETVRQSSPTHCSCKLPTGCHIVLCTTSNGCCSAQGDFRATNA
jgi:hypothetical protein